MAEATGRGERLSIWFFVGVITLLYGLVLVPVGLYEWHHPPANEIALPWLQPLHPTFWWGLMILVFGAYFTIRFWPRRGDEEKT